MLEPLSSFTNTYALQETSCDNDGIVKLYLEHVVITERSSERNLHDELAGLYVSAALASIDDSSGHDSDKLRRFLNDSDLYDPHPLLQRIEGTPLHVVSFLSSHSSS